MGYSKDDVQLGHHLREFGRHPTVNVKVHGWWRDTPIDPADLDIDEYDADEYTHDWIEAHVTGDQLDGWFWSAVESERDYLSDWADEIFARPCKLEFHGRSGGWAYLTHLPDIDDWDAVMLAKWRKFERAATSIADGIWSQVFSLIYLNVFPFWKARQAYEHAALLPVQIASAA